MRKRLNHVGFFALLAAAPLIYAGCIANNAGVNGSSMAATDASSSASTSDGAIKSPAPTGSPGPAFVACAGKVTLDGALSTDVNPPTWTWSRCTDPNPAYRISLDDANMPTNATNTTSFTPGSALHVGKHTLYVSQQRSDGSWSDVAALTIALLPRVQRGTVSAADPNADPSTAYAYPLHNGVPVAANLLEVSNPNGFSPDDIMQGQLGDCYFAATLAAITEVSPKYLNTLVVPLTDGYGDPVVDNANYPLYKLTMYYPDTSGAMQTWTMVTDAKLPSANGYVAYAQPSMDGQNLKIGIPLLEKGFAALDQSENFLNVVSQNAYSNGLGYVPVGDGGWSTYAFTALVGDGGQTQAMSAVSQSTLMALVASGTTAAAIDVNSGWVNPPGTLPSGATLTLNGDIYTYQPAGGGASFIVPNAHYYSLVSIKADGTTTLRNPWGGANDGQFSMPFEDLAPLFNRFTSAQLR